MSHTSEIGKSQPSRGRFRFSLLTLLGIFTLACLCVSNFRQMRITKRVELELDRVEMELRRREEEIGYIQVVDHSKAYVRRLASPWNTGGARVRIYLPSNKKFLLISEFVDQDGNVISSGEGGTIQLAEQATFEIEVEKKNGIWGTMTSYASGGSGHSASGPDGNWIATIDLRAKVAQESHAPAAIEYSLDQKIELLRLNATHPKDPAKSLSILISLQEVEESSLTNSLK